MRNSKVKGFTLVELIVVIAIIAILAAILVPNMLGYIKNSRWTQADANAKTVHTAATAALAQAYADGKIGAAGSLDTTNNYVVTNLKATVASVDLDLETGLGKTFKGKACFWTDASNTAVTAAAWCSDNASLPTAYPGTRNKKTETSIIGYFPVPTDET